MLNVAIIPFPCLTKTFETDTTSPAPHKALPSVTAIICFVQCDWTHSDRTFEHDVALQMGHIVSTHVAEHIITSLVPFDPNKMFQSLTPLHQRDTKCSLMWQNTKITSFVLFWPKRNVLQPWRHFTSGTQSAALHGRTHTYLPCSVWTKHKHAQTFEIDATSPVEHKSAASIGQNTQLPLFFPLTQNKACSNLWTWRHFANETQSAASCGTSGWVSAWSRCIADSGSAPYSSRAAHSASSVSRTGSARWTSATAKKIPFFFLAASNTWNSQCHQHLCSDYVKTASL